MLKQARIAVLVSGGGTNLQALIDAQGTVITSGKIELVVSNKPGAYALTRAANAGIPTAVVLGGEDFDRRLVDTLKNCDIDIVVLAGFMSILGETFINEYEGRIINVHPSLIPSFCGKGFYGLRVHKAALEYGVKVTGATVHYVNAIPDGGKIIMQKAVEVKDGDTPEVLQRRVMEEAEWVILPQACERVCADFCSRSCAAGQAEKSTD